MDLAFSLASASPIIWQAGKLASGSAVAEESDFPLFLKTEHSCGGEGVTMARNAAELDRELKFRSSSNLKRRLYSCAKRVIEGISFAAEKTHPESTVVRLVENREMDDIAMAMTTALGCSGFVSFDFMLDEKHGRAALIEMNPFCVGSSHLGGLFGHDICGALVSELSGLPAPQPLRSSEKKVVALFPKELERDPSNTYLHSPNVLHYVPTDEYALIEAYLERLTKLYPSRVDEIFEVVRREVGMGPPATRYIPIAEAFPATINLSVKCSRLLRIQVIQLEFTD
jgi:hypothetical protein